LYPGRNQRGGILKFLTKRSEVLTILTFLDLIRPKAPFVIDSSLNEILILSKRKLNFEVRRVENKKLNVLTLLVN
jgi:hypothetical protein